MKNIKLFEEFITEGRLNMQKMIKAAGKALKKGADNEDLDAFIENYLEDNNIGDDEFGYDEREELYMALDQQYDIYIEESATELIMEEDLDAMVKKEVDKLSKKYGVKSGDTMSAIRGLFGEPNSEGTAWSLMIYYGFGEGGCRVVFDPDTKLGAYPSQGLGTANDNTETLIEGKPWRQCIKAMEKWLKANA